MSKSVAMHHSNIELEERAKILFNSEWVSEDINNSNRVKWIESVNSLGSKWLYHKSNMVKRKGIK